MYLQPNAHQEHGQGEQPQETLVEATLKDAWRGSKHSHPYGVVGMEKKCRRASAASCPTATGQVSAPRPSKLRFLAAPVCTGISTHSKNNFCIKNYPNIAQEKAVWQRAPHLKRSFLWSPAAALSQAESTVPPERVHGPSLALAYYIVQKSVGEKQKPSLQPLEERIRKKQLFSNFFCPSAETRTSCRTKLWFWL